ncbi:thiamine diphosphokinase [Paenibacillus cymbidii]|uniref:thiamine diphosphokinase n=1 Tax=Paenibacillus cymbidii TaxID=1639034 RepID=UPI0010800E5E|nr:thiamine diphosphokinase [Paenibacillus cymbidii]
MSKHGKNIRIFSGGQLGEWALAGIAPSDILVGADRGALFLARSGLHLHCALGDFDSVTAEERAEIASASLETLAVDPVMKDMTDTEMAFEWAMAQRPASIAVCGALGTRFDHALANVHLLRRALRGGVPCAIEDAHNSIELIGPGRKQLVPGRFAHVSLLPLTDEVSGITLTGFRYPLHRARLAIGQSLGVSNVLEQPSGTIEVGTGELLVIRSSD